MFQITVVEKPESRILCSITFFENLVVCEIMWKSQATDDNVAHAHCMLDT